MAPKAKTQGKTSQPVSRPPTVIDARYSGVEVVTTALQVLGLEMRDDVSTKFRYAALGNGAGLVSRNAHRLLKFRQTQCDCVAEDTDCMVPYELTGGKADHVVSVRSIGERRAPCRRHSGSLCEVVARAPLDVVYLTTATMPSAGKHSAGAEAAERDGRGPVTPAILVRRPRFFVVVTTRNEELHVEGYHQVTRHFKHADLLSPIRGGMYLTLGSRDDARDDARDVERVMGAVRSMVMNCGAGVRSIIASMDSTRHAKRGAPATVSCDDRVKYYQAVHDLETAAKKVKVTLDIAANESDRPSAALRLTSIGGNARALALADAYEKAPLGDGDRHGPADNRIADVGKPFNIKLVQADGNLPELSKGSIPVSYQCLQPVSGTDIGYCKGLKFDKVSDAVMSANDTRDVACAAPSAVLVAFATAAIAVETGHVARR